MAKPGLKGRLRGRTPSFPHQVSAGGVVFKKSGPKVLICLTARKRQDAFIWCLPKGHVEEGEKLEQTALREVKEESGLWGSIISPLKPIHYWFSVPGERRRISKTVHFFLMRYVRGRLSDHDDEVECAEWCSADEALERAEYSLERKVIREAVKKLSKLA